MIMKMKKKYFFLGILSILYYSILLFFGNAMSFSIFWIILALFVMGLGAIKQLDRENKIKINSKVKKVFLICFALGMSSFVVVESFIIYFGKEKQMKESDYLLILGAGLHGETMSLTLSQRMEKGLEYLEKYPNTKVIVSGGQGPGEHITEAEAMERFLVSNGIDKKQIIKEGESTSTAENFKYSREVLDMIDKRKDIEVTVITTNFHMFRAKFLGEHSGFSTIYTVPSELHPILVPNYYVREYFAIINSLILDRLRTK